MTHITHVNAPVLVTLFNTVTVYLVELLISISKTFMASRVLKVGPDDHRPVLLLVICKWPSKIVLGSPEFKYMRYFDPLRKPK